MIADVGSPALMELTNFDDYQGQVVREGAVPPGGHPIKNRPLHLRQSQLRRTEDQVFQTTLTEHLIETVEHLDEPIGVENETVPGQEFNLFRWLELRQFGKPTKNAGSRFKKAESAIGNKHGWRLSCRGKTHPATALSKASSGHRKIETVDGEVIMHEIMKALQQGIRLGFAFECVDSFGIDTVCHERRTYPVAANVRYDDTEGIVTMREDNTEVTANRAGG